MDETTLDKQVRESIRNALREGQLDLTIAASPGAEDDEEDDVDFDAENDENEGGDSGAKNSDAPPGESRSCETDDSVKVPKVAVWYRNAIMRDLWENASSSQRDAVERHKRKQKGEETDEDDDEMGDGEKQAKRLRDIMRFVRHVSIYQAHTIHEAAERLWNMPWFAYSIKSLKKLATSGRFAWPVLTL